MKSRVANRFLNMLHDEALSGGHARLIAPLHYVTPWGEHLEVPKGFRTDFASVPSLARFGIVFASLFQILAVFYSPWFYILEAFCAWVIFVAEWLENRDSDMAAVVHDWLFKTRRFGFWKSNLILFYALRANGAPSNPLWKRWLFLINVCLFGWIPWIQDKPK